MVLGQLANHRLPVRTASFKFAASSILAAFTVASPSVAKEEISGAYHDHTITNRPER